MLKNKHILFLTLILVIGALGSNVMALEITYPVILGLPNLNEGLPSINAFAAYFFGIAMYLAGFFAIISFTIGAIGLINPSIEAHGEAKDRMKGAVLGLGLTLISFIIIQTINPNLAIPVWNPPEGLENIFLINSTTGEKTQCPSGISNTSALPVGFDQIKYCCDKTCGAITGPQLLVWKFNNVNLEQGNSDLTTGVTIETLVCGATTNINKPGSLKVAIGKPGIYYYLSSNCTGYVSTENVDRNDEITPPFKGKIKSAKIVNLTNVANPEGSAKYGVIFHETMGLENGGKCSDPITNGGDSFSAAPCNAISINPSAVDIIQLNQTPETSGDYVYFYSEPYGWDTGANAGFWPKLSDSQDISSVGTSWLTENMIFDYTNVDQPDAYQLKFKNFRSRSGSIEITGDYLVALYSDSYCQTFVYDDVENLNAQPIVARGSDKISKVYIAPITYGGYTDYTEN